MHINRGNRTIPAQYLDRLDFYMFQPGHNYEGQPEAWHLPQDFIANYPKKPMVNSEPCYEQMGASRNVYWRFTAQDCRASVWSSILAGASAGVTYGAHGVWNWQTSKSQGSVPVSYTHLFSSGFFILRKAPKAQPQTAAIAQLVETKTKGS